LPTGKTQANFFCRINSADSGRHSRTSKFRSQQRHLANAIALAYTARAVFILHG